jgi:mitochondrial pyruvate carrier 1
MTAALCLYSGTFMRYALAVTPKNYLLFGCHVVNFSAQSTQAYRFVNYWYMGGKEKAAESKAKEGIDGAAEKLKEGVEKVKEKVQ